MWCGEGNQIHGFRQAKFQMCNSQVEASLGSQIAVLSWFSLRQKPIARKQFVERGVLYSFLSRYQNSLTKTKNVFCPVSEFPMIFERANKPFICASLIYCN